MDVHDDDAGRNGKLTLTLEGSGTSNFSIDPKGFVFSTTPLDYETKDSYTMKVVAKDGGDPFKSDSAQVKITIINVNDNVPVFQKTEAMKIREDVAIGTQVVTMNATDSDNNKLFFRITRGNTGGAFQIAQETGLITVAAKLDREQVVNYTLLVEARDSGNFSVWNNASIQVTDANDNTPVFAPQKYTAQLAENLPSGILEHNFFVSVFSMALDFCSLSLCVCLPLLLSAFAFVSLCSLLFFYCSSLSGFHLPVSRALYNSSFCLCL